MSIREATERPLESHDRPWVINYVEKAHQRLQLGESTQFFQRLLKIGKKNFQTYMFILFV